MASININITTSEAYTTLASRLNLKSSDYKQNLPKIANFLEGLASGNADFTSGLLDIITTSTAEVSFTGIAANNETITINGDTFTAKTSGAVAADGEFDISGNLATQAANLIAAINAVADTRIAGKVTAATNTTYVATMTSTGTAANDETFVLNGVTFTAKTSGAVAADGEFDISATPATQATNIAAAINAVADVEVDGVVFASSSAGVVYIYSVAGVALTALSLTESLSNVTRTEFASGTSGLVTISADYPSTATGGYSISESMQNTTVTAWALDANASATTI